MKKISKMKNGHGVSLHAPLNVVSVFYLTGVGSRGFVDRVKSILGVLALGRKTIESGEPHQLREPSIPYVAHFGVKKSDIESKNTYSWNV